MRKLFALLVFAVVFTLAGYSVSKDAKQPQVADESASLSEQTAVPAEGSTRSNADTKMEEGNMMYIKVGDTKLTAVLEDNKTVDALKKYFGKSLTLSTSTYGGFERGCILDTKLPVNFFRKFIAPVPGDIMLYSNNEFMIYFGPNSAYRYTRIGRINATEEELKALLGGAETIDITFSFEK